MACPLLLLEVDRSREMILLLQLAHQHLVVWGRTQSSALGSAFDPCPEEEKDSRSPSRESQEAGSASAGTGPQMQGADDISVRFQR